MARRVHSATTRPCCWTSVLHELKTLFDSDSEVIYVEPGYLLYIHAGNLLAQEFDARRLAITSQPLTVAQDVTLNSARRAGFFTAANSGSVALSTRSRRIVQAT